MFDAPIDFDPVVFSILGVRATTATGSIKWVDQYAQVNNAPTLTVDSASVDLAYNAVAGPVSGADADATDEEGDAVSYSLVGTVPDDGQGNDLFSINSSNGEISLTTAGAAYLGKMGSFRDYSVSVQATAGGMLSNVGSILIKVAPPEGSVLVFDAFGEFVSAYETIQAAVTAASADFTVMVKEGAYSGLVEINKKLTILGAMADVDGSEGSRGTGESALTGGILLNNGSAGSVINGLRILEGTAMLGQNAGIYVGDDDIDISHMLIERAAAFSSFRGIITETNDGQGLVVTDSKVSGFATGMYINPGSDAVVTSNLFTGNNVGLSTDYPSTAQVSGNTFDNLLEQVGVGLTAGTSDVSAVIGSNTFLGSAPEVSIYGSGSADSITGTVNKDVVSALGANDVLKGGVGNDALLGGAGTDTASYTASITAAMITAVADVDPVTAGAQAGWQVATGGTEGTDSIAGVEIVDGAEGGKFLLVGSGGFATIQAAIDAAAAGDTILVAAGTYGAPINISKAVTLIGANAGIEGDATRGSESEIAAKITVNAAATINGFKIVNSTANGTAYDAVQVQTSGEVTIKNNVFYSTGPNGSSATIDRGVYLTTAATGKVTVEDNFFTGLQTTSFGDANWTSAVWSDGNSSDLEITDNTFNYVRTAMNLDRYDASKVEVSFNNILQAGSGISVGVNAVGTALTFAGIHDNTFNVVGTDFNFQNIGADKTVSINLDATNNLAVSGQEMTVLLGGGGDTMTGTNGNDVITGNAGNDDLTGLLGADSFLFNRALGPTNIDRIMDFSGSVGDGDKIRLDDAIFIGLTTATLGTDFGTKILYDSGSGALSFDQDGVGVGAAVQFASLGTGLSITAADFLIY